MRISTSQIYRQGLSGILDQQQALSKTQRQLSKGEKLLSPADDPASSARTMALEHRTNEIDQFQRNINSTGARLGHEERSLSSLTDRLQRARELTIKAGNGAYTAVDLRSLAVEVDAIRADVLEIANGTDPGGHYLFAGYSTQNKPFLENAAGAVTYLGDQGQRQQPVGFSREIADGDPGNAVFEGMRNGNGVFRVDAGTANAGTGMIADGGVFDPSAYPGTSMQIVFTAPDQFDVVSPSGPVLTGQTYTDGSAIEFAGVRVTINGQPQAGDTFDVEPSTTQSVFDTLDNFLATLNLNPQDEQSWATLSQGLHNTLKDLDQALDHVSATRGTVGERLLSLDNQDEANQDLKLLAETTLSEVRDLDYAEALTRLSSRMVVLEAAQTSFVQLSGLSLFKLLR
jgi:flagellar hook-associated protein 3 FlgL